DAWTLQSDAESCAGQVLLDTAARSGKATTMIDAMGAATAVGWAILKEFFTQKTALFAGVRGDETLRGLRLDVKDGRWFLVVGVPYARATNASTMDQRTKEMAEILDMRAAGRTGTVMMK
ncbi:MAG TPA: hypothetical protein VGE96_02385, partial [Steroidobacteraceae bacterium]